MIEIKNQYELLNFLMRNLTTEQTTTSEKMLLTIVACHASHKNNWKCWPSLSVLTRKSCMTRPTVMKVSKSLKEKGFLKWDKGNSTKSNRYWIDVSSIGRMCGVEARYADYCVCDVDEVVTDVFDEPPF